MMILELAIPPKFWSASDSPIDGEAIMIWVAHVWSQLGTGLKSKSKRVQFHILQELLQERGWGRKLASECEDGGALVQIHEKETYHHGLQGANRWDRETRIKSIHRLFAETIEEEDLCSSNHFILDRIAEKESTDNLHRSGSEHEEVEDADIRQVGDEEDEECNDRDNEDGKDDDEHEVEENSLSVIRNICLKMGPNTCF